MEAKETTRQNPIRRLLDCKRELRECIQKGGGPNEMQQIASSYGLTFAKPV